MKAFKAFRWNRTPDENSTLSRINMTPLTDVSLVLVVILLLTTPLAFESSFGIGRTDADSASDSEPTPAQRLRVDILSDNEVRVDDMVVSVRALPAIIATLLATTESKEIAVHCADLVSHGTFVQVLDITKLSGATNIAVAGN